MVGERSGDPKDWAGEAGRRAIVIAHDSEEAKATIDDLVSGQFVNELHPSEPMVVFLEDVRG